MAETIQNQFHPDLVLPPGETIKESLDGLGMKQAELAKRMGASEKYVIDLLSGAAPLSAETALKLERVFNVPSRFWTNLEQSYRDYLAREAEAARLKASADWTRQFPFKEMAKLRWLESGGDSVTNTHRLLTYFGCASEAQWHGVWEKVDAVYRHSARQKSDPHALAAWLRRGQLEAVEQQLPAHEPATWASALSTIRANISADPQQFQKVMTEQCRRAGVGLIFLPALPNVAVCGACVWHNQNPWIYLSLRYKTDDHLWFSFFHEAKHVLQNVRKRLFVDEPQQAINDPLEVAANSYAAEILIPADAYDRFVQGRRFDAANVERFANELRLTTGVVVGRLQHDGHVSWASPLNRLKTHYVWAIP
ncbi:MAG TPA: HigA family addiction module antitoxin [Opitutaceae bacterium]|nr:HigA family addiction module antitoxin [Opitutaceae bacterium]